MLAQVVGSVFGSLLIVSVSGCQPLYISVCTFAFQTVLEPALQFDVVHVN